MYSGTASARRRIAATALAVALGSAGAFVAPAPALAAAGSATMVNGVFTFRAAAGQDNDVNILATMDRHLNVGDRVAITAGTGCTNVSPTFVQCAGYPTSLQIFLGDGDDNADISVPYPKLIDAGPGRDTIRHWGSKFQQEVLHTLRGGPGDDTIYGSQGRDRIDGGPGMDKLYGRESGDEINGGPEMDYIYGDEDDDTLRGDDGNDWIYGGDGHDKIEPGRGPDMVDGGNGNDRVTEVSTTTSPAEDANPDNDGDLIFGGPGKDVLSGGDDNDSISGGLGNDVIIGGGGRDNLLGEGGGDELSAGDRRVTTGRTDHDWLDCGADDGDIFYRSGTEAFPVGCEMEG